MKLIIDIPDMDKEKIVNYFGCCTPRLESTIQNSIILPENSTNWDIIQKLFPNGELFYFGRCLNYRLNDANFQAVIEWWNAPYIKEDAEAECKEG